MNKSIYAARCVRCNESFTAEQIQGVSACPGCGSKGVPMNPANDVIVRINVHELRILGIWAENHAVTCDNLQLDNAYHESMKETVAAITGRLRTQLSNMGCDMPLTLSAEFKQVEKAYPGAQLFIDGREEVA